MKVIAITQARVGSSRLPEKVLKAIKGKTLLETHLERLMNSKRIDQLIVATTSEPKAELIKTIAEKWRAKVYQGSIHDVLDRFYQAVKNEEVDYVVRLTADCPLIDASLVDQVIDFMLLHKVDYVSNTLKPSFPDGEDIEVFTFEALEKAWTSAKLKSEREHVTPFIWKNSSYFQQSLFTSLNYSCEVDHSAVRLTVDEQRDFDTIQHLVEQLGSNARWHEYANYYAIHEAQMPNSNIRRNDGYEKSILEEN
jgi:spore coat polysaccharide biosynthesis protein SpsF (cytidylyltransferase family)